ncbi:SMC-Scp complex subunit ScpB [Anaerotignum lactatifermentans]|uniref:Segregation and condensation protein B n=1 Tax=Anaerotignum lactatifermentans TaxID=160404 RepID=A0ABS2G6D2_9FIRM|nr:SMC-Scp complex subunit ScpB [Anaerotignum lactatifermentans]MBM6828155.1 SMC-Scp complex subunit ScpB [Anaerotignum lactatifermentans]MBM6876682.1 SMC-Scp complex subunit ScpB [Anaerotignum lactatifermentans]MBM6949738.1 SMC-Scp complex subunit ScpB [Anaerotignum lactatifermentans]
MRLAQLEAVVESLLFISGEAVSLSAIAQTIEMDKATARAIIQSLADKYEEEHRGIRIVEINDAYQMCTAAECFEYIRNMYKSPQRQGLTQSLLETLAIIAYKQPITKGQIEEIRGVSADHAVNKLVEKKLVCEVGRQNTPGKPILFGTTDDFLRYFGFKSVGELPPLEEEMTEETEETAQP